MRTHCWISRFVSGLEAWDSRLNLYSLTWEFWLFWILPKFYSMGSRLDLDFKAWESGLNLNSTAWHFWLDLRSTAWDSNLTLLSSSWDSRLVLDSMPWDSGLNLVSSARFSRLELASMSWGSGLWLHPPDWHSRLDLDSTAWHSPHYYFFYCLGCWACLLVCLRRGFMVLGGYSGSLPQSKDIQIRLIGIPKLYILCEGGYEFVRLSLATDWHPI